MRSIVYHPQLVAVHHQSEALYIIKPQGKYTLARDEIQGCNAPLIIYATLRAVMICQAYGLDKQKENFW